MASTRFRIPGRRTTSITLPATRYQAMLFNSYPFIILFLPLTLVVFYGLTRANQTHKALAWLVVASLFFYGWWNPVYLLLLTGSVLINFGFGLYLNDGEDNLTKDKKPVLALGIICNLAILGVFKYANFFADTANSLTGSGWQLPTIVLPLAISFFTFQQIAYLVDRFHNRVPEHQFLHYALYVVFFPQLIAGPIVRPGEILEQYTKHDRSLIKPETLSIGLTLFAIGLFKKVGLADPLSQFATPVFTAAQGGTVPGTLEAWTGALAYTFQLYFDFSGYSDMALGLARMFGFRLPINFNSPYKAGSIIEFWRRWHITLSRFMLDYLYIPLGGNREGKTKRNFYLIITLLLGGLWHGAQWTFVAWGALHGVCLAINHVWQEQKKTIGFTTDGAGHKWVMRTLTFLVLVLTWVLFRAESFDAALNMYQAMAGGGTTTSILSIKNAWGWLLAGGLIAWCLPNSMEWLGILSETQTDNKPSSKIFQWQPTPAWAFAVLSVAIYSLFQMTEVSEFLYFQF